LSKYLKYNKIHPPVSNSKKTLLLRILEVKYTKSSIPTHWSIALYFPFLFTCEHYESLYKLSLPPSVQMAAKYVARTRECRQHGRSDTSSYCGHYQQHGPVQDTDGPPG